MLTASRSGSRSRMAFSIMRPVAAAKPSGSSAYRSGPGGTSLTCCSSTVIGSPSSSSASDAERSGYARVATVSPRPLYRTAYLTSRNGEASSLPDTGKKACGSPAMETGGDVPGGGIAGVAGPDGARGERSPARRPVAGVPATSGVSPAISSRVRGPRR